MKKKILSLVICCALIFTCMIGFMGCSKKEETNKKSAEVELLEMIGEQYYLLLDDKKEAINYIFENDTYLDNKETLLLNAFESFLSVSILYEFETTGNSNIQQYNITKSNNKYNLTYDNNSESHLSTVELEKISDTELLIKTDENEFYFQIDAEKGYFKTRTNIEGIDYYEFLLIDDTVYIQVFEKDVPFGGETVDKISHLQFTITLNGHKISGLYDYKHVIDETPISLTEINLDNFCKLHGDTESFTRERND